MDEDVGSKYLVHKLFGKELGDAMKDAEGSYRKIIETTTPVTQCIRAGHPFKNDGTDVCYICGLMIPPKEDRNPQRDELYPECEHILPVGHARMFLDIYSTKQSSDLQDFSKQMKEWYERAIYLEYGQAHKVCNQAKSNSSYIGNPEFWETKLQFNEESTRGILETIKNRATLNLKTPSLSEDDRIIMNGISKMNINERIAAIYPIVQSVLDHIGTRNPSESALLLLARISELRNPSRLPDKARLVYQQYGKRIDTRAEEIQAIEDVIFKFIPQLRPGQPIKTLIYEGKYINVPPEHQLQLDDAGLKEILSLVYSISAKTFSAYATPQFIHLVYYAIYSKTLQKFKESKPAKIPIWVCRMLGIMHTTETSGSMGSRVSVIALKNKITLDTKELRRDCLNVERSERRKSRTAEGVMEDVDDDKKEQDSIDTLADDLYENIGYALYEELLPYINNKSITSAQASAFSDEAVDFGKAIFKKGILDGKDMETVIKISSNEAAILFSSRLLLILGKEKSDEFSDKVTSIILSRVQKGGLRKQRKSKSNARRSHSRNIRTTYRKGLRKRTGKGRTHRVRQRTGKSRSGK